MRLALIGDHSDGRAFATAAIATGRYEVVAFCGRDVESARSINPAICVTADVEDVLADPSVKACIVACPIDKRLDVARRVLQSERHALVVHPVDFKPDGAYELAMLQGDTHQVLLPLLPEAMLELTISPATNLIDLTVTDDSEALLGLDNLRNHPAFPCWTLLRRIGGDIAEVSAFGAAEEVEPGATTLINGRYESGMLFRASYSRRAGPRNIAAIASSANGTEVIELARHNDCWLKVVEVFDRAVAKLATMPRAEPAAGLNSTTNERLSWQDEIHAAELNDAAARSLAKRRSSLMEYQAANEEVGFKGTMTLVGCGLIWVAILLLVFSAWQPWLGWLILPALVIFLGLQLLRWIIR